MCAASPKSWTETDESSGVLLSERAGKATSVAPVQSATPKQKPNDDGPPRKRDRSPTYATPPNMPNPAWTIAADLSRPPAAGLHTRDAVKLAGSGCRNRAWKPMPASGRPVVLQFRRSQLRIVYCSAAITAAPTSPAAIPRAKSRLPPQLFRFILVTTSVRLRSAPIVARIGRAKPS
jgi:hypothetical protein